MAVTTMGLSPFEAVCAKKGLNNKSGFAEPAVFVKSLLGKVSVVPAAVVWIEDIPLRGIVNSPLAWGSSHGRLHVTLGANADVLSVANLSKTNRRI